MNPLNLFARLRPASFACVVALALLGASCAEPTGTASPCRDEPAGSLNVFLADSAGAPDRARISGRLVSLEPGSQEGPGRAVLRDSAGVDHSIALDLPGSAPPLAVGRRYEALLEYAGGTPPACGVVISDSAGLVLAGASDQGIGAHVMKSLPAGWGLTLERTDCESRPKSACYRSITNSTLVVTRGQAARSLWNGQSVTIDGYRVACLTAQHVEYTPRCADAALYEVSWVIVRESAGSSAH